MHTNLRSSNSYQNTIISNFFYQNQVLISIVSCYNINMFTRSTYIFSACAVLAQGLTIENNATALLQMDAPQAKLRYSDVVMFCFESIFQNSKVGEVDFDGPLTAADLAKVREYQEGMNKLRSDCSDILDQQTLDVAQKLGTCEPHELFAVIEAMRQ